MGFLGRCEATRVPTTENDTVQVGRTAIEGPSQAVKISPRVRPLRRARIKLATASTTHSRHSDQASQAAARVLTLPMPCLSSLAPSVTTPHSTVLPSPKRREKCCEDRYLKREGNELPRTPLWRSSQKIAKTKLAEMASRRLVE